MTSSAAEEIPAEMKQLVLTSPGKGTCLADCTVVLKTVPTPEPEAGEVLIKVIATPINPSNYSNWYKGTCLGKKASYPIAIGLEGCGVVVATKAGALAGFRCPVGTKVGFLPGKMPEQGLYLEYVTCNATTDVFLMPNDVPIEDCAGFFVNPFTVISMLDTVKTKTSRKGKAFLHTAAAGQLGQMLNKAAPMEGMEVLNVVRREEQAKLLRGLGAKHVVVTSGNEDAWKEELKAKINKLGVTIAFDVVAGTMTGALIDVMPPKSTVYVYGVLLGPIGNVSPAKLIYGKKQVKGYFLSTWITKGGLLHMMSHMFMAGKKVNAGLKDRGWSRSQFHNITMEEAFEAIVLLVSAGGSTTGKKLRVRLDK